MAVVYISLILIPFLTAAVPNCTFQQPSILPRPPSLFLDEPLPSCDCRDGHLRGVSLQPCHHSTRISESLTLLKLFLLPCAWKAVLLQVRPSVFLVPFHYFLQDFILSLALLQHLEVLFLSFFPSTCSDILFPPLNLSTYLNYMFFSFSFHHRAF